MTNILDDIKEKLLINKKNFKLILKYTILCIDELSVSIYENDFSNYNNIILNYLTKINNIVQYIYKKINFCYFNNGLLFDYKNKCNYNIEIEHINIKFNENTIKLSLNKNDIINILKQCDNLNNIKIILENFLLNIKLTNNIILFLN